MAGSTSIITSSSSRSSSSSSIRSSSSGGGSGSSGGGSSSSGSSSVGKMEKGAGGLVYGVSNEGGVCTSWPPPDCPAPAGGASPGGEKREKRERRDEWEDRRMGKEKSEKGEKGEKGERVREDKEREQIEESESKKIDREIHHAVCVYHMCSVALFACLYYVLIKPSPLQAATALPLPSTRAPERRCGVARPVSLVREVRFKRTNRDTRRHEET